MAFVPQTFAAEVGEVETPYPGARRVVLSGAGLAGWRSSGYADEWVHLGLPGQATRLYTVLDHDQVRAQVVLEISLRSRGPVGRWARRVQPGDRVQISQPTGRYRPPPEVSWVWLVADHAGFPALRRILEAPPALVSSVIVPPDLASVLTGGTRTSSQARSLQIVGSDDLAGAVRESSPPPGPGYLWMGAEAAATRAVRRHLRRSWSWTADRFAVAGYWQRRDPDYENRYRAVADQVAALYDELQAGSRNPDLIADDLDDMLDRHRL